MDWKLEGVCVPVSDIDRAKAFYAERAGFTIDYDSTFTEDYRVVQDSSRIPVLDPDRDGGLGGGTDIPAVARSHGAGLAQGSTAGRSRHRGGPD